MVLELGIFMDVSPWLPLLHLTFGCLSSSLHENLRFPTELSTTVYNSVKMHQDSGSEECVCMFWDSTKVKQEQHWLSSCYHSPGFLPEGSFGLGERWGRSSILLLQSCLLFKAHLLRVFQKGTSLCFYMGCWDLADVLQLTMMGFYMQKLITAHTGGLQATELPLLGEGLHSHPVDIKQSNQMIFAKSSFLDFFFFSLEKGNDDHTAISSPF